MASVTIPYSVNSIGEKAFHGCTALASVTIPNSVTSIGVWAFFGCSSLASVTIPNSVNSIGVAAFAACASLTNIEVERGNPSFVSSDGILYNKGMTTLLQCPGAKMTVMIPNSVNSIGERAFFGCTSLASLTIHNSVTSIGTYAFGGCTALASVTIPNSVTSIGRWAFSGCTSLASVTIPNSVTSIEAGAFKYCTSLTSVTIPKSVTSIGAHAFNDCTNIQTIYCIWDTPFVCDTTIWYKTVYTNAILYVPEGCTAAYKATKPWSKFINIKEYSLAGIDRNVTVDGNDKTIIATYDISGKPVAPNTTGTIIVRYSDGTAGKVIIRNPQ